MNYYNIKGSSYYSGTRLDIISFLPTNQNQSVLEIGAGGGDSLCFIKENKLAKEVVGVELFELKGSNQNNPLIDQFIFANIEELNLSQPQDHFDVIILGDVLEHLIDPWKTLTYIRKFLKKNGTLLISLPNIRELNSLLKIFWLGDFKYSDDGVLDKTHLRFFCKKNMIELFNNSNLSIQSSKPAFKIRSDRKSRRLINQITLGLFEQFLAIQYVFELKLKDAS